MRGGAITVAVLGAIAWTLVLLLYFSMAMVLYQKGFGTLPTMFGILGLQRFAVPAVGLLLSLATAFVAARTARHSLALAVAFFSLMLCCAVWLYPELLQWT